MSEEDAPPPDPGLSANAMSELRAICGIYVEAGGLLVKLTTYAGRMAESALDRLPGDWKAQVAIAAEKALHHASQAAGAMHAPKGSGSLFGKALGWASGGRWHVVATGVSGAVTGLAGLPGALVDLPVSTTLILRSIQEVAAECGEDIADPAVRAECVSVFGMGGPGGADEQGGVSLAAARIAASGKTISEIIGKVVPHFTSAVLQRVAAKAVPVIGAVAGGGINVLFATYYRSLATVHFRLRKLARIEHPDRVYAAFDEMVRSHQAKARALTAVANERPAWAR